MPTTNPSDPSDPSNLFTLLDHTARRWPDDGAIFEGARQLHTWAALRRRALRLAGALRASGADRGRIAIISENAPEYAELMFGAWAALAAVTPVNYKLHPREMVQIIEDAEPALIFVSAALAPALEASLDARWRRRVVVIGSAQYAALFDHAPADVPATDPDTLAWLFYTSGTTGRSKGAMLSHRALMAMVRAHLADVEAIDAGCSQIHAAPMSHGSGLYLPAYVSCGARQVIPASRGFDADEFLALCDVHPRCSVFLAPTMVQRLRRAALAADMRPRGLRTIVYGGGPMYVDDLMQSIAVFGQVFVQIYGQGEAPMTITCLPRADHARADAAVLGSVGLPRTGSEVRVVDAEGHDLPPGQLGEVITRGEVVMSGYWRNPEGTAATLRDGWLHTGDLGAFDAAGYLTLSDRSKDVIISGGSNIYPREVEEALLTHPGVSEVAVIGQADAEWGEIVVAFVVAQDGRGVAPAELDGHCLTRIARFKRPKRYVFVTELPKNSYGKVLKRELRERLQS